jgi:hypothetical protein
LKRSSCFIFVALAALTSSVAARAEESGCDKFAWPVQAEQKLLQRSEKIAAQSGKSFNGLPDGPIELALVRLDQAGFDKPPERAPKNPDSFAGFLKLAAIPAGVVQISLSRATWVDAIQAGRYLKPAAHSGALDCPGIRKIVKFELQQGSVILQFSGVETNSLALLIAPAPAQ